MKYFVKFIVVTFFSLICTNTFAEQKIAVLDLTYLLNESKAGKDAQEFLKKTFNENKKNFLEIQKSLKEEEKDLLAKKNILSKEDYGKKMNALRKKNMDYQTQRRASIDKKYILGGNPKIDITKIIVEKLNKDFPSLNLK